MRSMSVLFASENRFAGTLPNRAVAGLRLFGVTFNDFEGEMSQTQCGQTLPTIHYVSQRQKANLQHLQGI
eukprot:6203460-Amphidinium_carterae.1